MQRLKSFVLLMIMGMVLFPWHMVCAAHPMGHDHHETVGPSKCELLRIISQQEGEHLLPPMECGQLSSLVAEFDQVQIDDLIVPTVQMVAILAVVFELVTLDYQEQPFLLPPDPNCRSATLLSDSPLRAPPLV